MKRNISCQSGNSYLNVRDASTQIGPSDGSYSRRRSFEGKPDRITYDVLVSNYMFDRDYFISWLMDFGLIASKQACDICQFDMILVKTTDRSDGLKWECRRRLNGKRHKCQKSIRKDSFFEQRNMSLEEITKFVYWWTQNLTQIQIRNQLRTGSSTAVDWDMFCREVSEIIIVEEGVPIGGPGRRVQIDESKIGKRKYHRGHYVEGQWVFGGIDEESRECFIFPVDKRDESTLMPMVKKWILPGTTIVSDCWKAYTNLSINGYVHKSVNHSEEFVNEDGDHTYKIERHWRQMKASLPTHGRRKLVSTLSHPSFPDPYHRIFLRERSFASPISNTQKVHQTDSNPGPHDQ